MHSSGRPELRRDRRGRVPRAPLPVGCDPTLCESACAQDPRPAIMTTQPRLCRLWLSGGTVYTVSHLTQHWPGVLKSRLQAHGFSRVRICGSGKMSRYLGYYFRSVRSTGVISSSATSIDRPVSRDRQRYICFCKAGWQNENFVKLSSWTTENPQSLVRATFLVRRVTTSPTHLSMKAEDKVEENINAKE